MTQGVFITGTDTGSGKTYYACRLLVSLQQAGVRAAAMKPVAAGAQWLHGELQNDDALKLQQAMNVKLPYAQINPYCFAPAIAPHLAAADAGIEIDIVKLQQGYQAISGVADMTVVEGVGGWQTPLNATQTVADLAVALQLPVILVVAMRLGCVNQALLSAQSIRDSGARLIGWVANIMQTEMQRCEDNIQAIAQRIDVPLRDILLPVTDKKTEQHVCVDGLFD